MGTITIEKGEIEGTGRRGQEGQGRRTQKKETKERRKIDREDTSERRGGGDLLATASFLPWTIVHRRKSLEG